MEFIACILVCMRRSQQLDFQIENCGKRKKGPHEHECRINIVNKKQQKQQQRTTIYYVKPSRLTHMHLFRDMYNVYSSHSFSLSHTHLLCGSSIIFLENIFIIPCAVAIDSFALSKKLTLPTLQIGGKKAPRKMCMLASGSCKWK